MSLAFKIKKFCIKNFYRLANPFRRLYWRIVKPKTTGVRCLLKRDNKFLLVKLSYGRYHWTIPGGGVGKKENPETAVCREICEEVGIKILDPIFIGQYTQDFESKIDTVFYFLKEVNNLEFKIDEIEIDEAAWFLLRDLPEKRSKAVDRIIEMYENYLANHI